MAKKVEIEVVAKTDKANVNIKKTTDTTKGLGKEAGAVGGKFDSMTGGAIAGTLQTQNTPPQFEEEVDAVNIADLPHYEAAGPTFDLFHSIDDFRGAGFWRMAG